MKKNGFTLIELLVVIAIIGILATIVLASLNTARNRSKDAKIKEELHQVRSEAGIYYERYSSYIQGIDPVTGEDISLCENSGALDNFRDSIMAIVDLNNNGFADCAIPDNGESYAIEVSRNGDTIWCVDSTGFAGPTSTANTDRICDGSNYCGGNDIWACVPE